MANLIVTTSTLQQYINAGREVDVSYYKTSFLEKVNDIEYSIHNIFYDYMDILNQFKVNIELNSEEYNKYIYKPRLLAYYLYGSTDLYFIIMIANNICNEKEFNKKKIKLFKPSVLPILNEIINAESKYLNINKYKVDTSSDDTYNNFVSGKKKIKESEEDKEKQNKTTNILYQYTYLFNNTIYTNITEDINTFLPNSVYVNTKYSCNILENKDLKNHSFMYLMIPSEFNFDIYRNGELMDTRYSIEKYDFTYTYEESTYDVFKFTIEFLDVKDTDVFMLLLLKKK